MTELYYVEVDSEGYFYYDGLIYKDCIFSSKEKCNKLLELAIVEYGENCCEICSLLLDPIVGEKI